MDVETAIAYVGALRASDRTTQGTAFDALSEATSTHVPWAREVWDELVDGLAADDNRQRSICAQLLANLAAHSDPDARILADLDRLGAVMRDERFVTARHATQAFWRVGLGGDAQAEAVIDVLSTRFRDCVGEKNAALVRTDIATALGHLDGACASAAITSAVESLLAEEPDEGARRKQAAAWRKARRSTG